jgi:hypothetical protein
VRAHHTAVYACITMKNKKKIGIFQYGIDDTIHLMTYIAYIKFLEGPNKNRRNSLQNHQINNESYFVVPLLWDLKEKQRF